MAANRTTHPFQSCGSHFRCLNGLAPSYLSRLIGHSSDKKITRNLENYLKIHVDTLSDKRKYLNLSFRQPQLSTFYIKIPKSILFTLTPGIFSFPVTLF